MIRLFLGKLFQERSIWLLPVAAFTLTSGIAFMVIGGSMFFFTMENPEAGFYAILAALALVLLAIPMFSLMTSAARLMARRRDERLSSLRLIGASTAQLRRLAVAEAAVLALAGLLGGSLLYAALMPAVGLLPFGGSPMGVQGLWMGLDIWALSFLGLLAAATAAALLGMRRIQVTPLGVRTLQSPARVHWVRVVLAVLGVIAAQVLARLSGFGSVAMAVTVSLIAVAVPLVVVQLVGPWVLKVVTRRHLKKAQSVERLIAARSVLESPQQMWKQIGGVSITTYVGVIAGCGLGIITAGDGGVSTQEQILMADVQRGVWLTLAVAFLMAAGSVGVNQTAQVLDRKHLYSSLAKMGMDVQQLQRIRTLSVMRSLGIVVTIALITAAVTAFPIIGIAVVTAPATVVTALVVLSLGMLAVYAGAQVTRPTMRRVAFAH